MLERLRAARPRPLPMDFRARAGRAADLVHRLLVDLAELGYGLEPDLGYLAAPVAESITALYGRYTQAGCRVEADFGETATATADVPDDSSAAVHVDLVIEDRSVLRTVAGRRQPLPAITWRMRLVLDAACAHVVAMALERA